MKQLVDAIVSGQQPDGTPGVSLSEIEPATSKINRANIEAYPAPIGDLSEQSWQSSIYSWTGEYWAVLVDLTTTDGKVSDLVLHAKIRCTDRGYMIEPGLIYVP